MKNRNKSILILMMLMLTLTIVGLSGCANKEKEETIKIWNKTGYEININDNKIKKDEAFELKKRDKKADKYDINISYNDGSKYALGSIKISEINSKIEIRYEDGITYLLYETKNGKIVNTKKEELNKQNEQKTKEDSTENNAQSQKEPVESNKNQNNDAVKKEAPSSNDTSTNESSNNDNCVDVDDPNNYY